MTDLAQWWVLALACGAAGTAGFGASHWWSGRKIVALKLQLDKVEKARQFVQVQTAQTRKQIERLQADLAAQQREMGERIRAGHQRVQQLQQALAAFEPASAPVHEVPVHGFADTQPMESARAV